MHSTGKELLRDESQVVKDENAKDGLVMSRRCRRPMHGLGNLQWRRSCYDGATIDSEMADDDLADDQACLAFVQTLHRPQKTHFQRLRTQARAVTQ